MVVEQLLENASARADKAEVFYGEAESTRVSFKAGKLRESGIVNTRGLGLRLFARGRAGFASTTNFDRLDDVVEGAVATASHGREADYELPDGRGDYVDVKTYDEALTKLAPRTMIEMGEHAAEMIAAADERAIVAVEIERAVGRTRLVNSAGFDRTEEATSYSFGVVVQRTAENDILTYYAYDASVARDIDAPAIVRRLIDSLRWADKIVEVETGKMDLLFDPDEVPTLMVPVVTCLNGAYVADRSSALAGRLGEEVANPSLTVVDDATAPFGVRAEAFDGEGTPCRRRPLIERGVLTSFVTDLATAARLGTPSSGHARRGVASPPHPGVSNVIVESGEKSAADLIAETKLGLWILNAAGGSMGNTRGGELSANIAYALKIENGEIVGRVKDCLFAGNVFEMLGPRLRGLSSDTRRAGGCFMTPTIVVADQTVTA